MKRAEVRWYSFTGPDKRRPVVILSRDSIIAYMQEVTVAPVTSHVRDIPSEVVLTQVDGMPRTCAVNCDHLQTVAKDKLGALITKLGATRMDQVAQAIAFALGM